MSYKFEVLEQVPILKRGIKNWNFFSAKRGLSFIQLEILYKEISEKLSKRRPRSIEKTIAERHLFKKIRSKTKLDFNQSFWIGCFNYDLFFAQVGTKGKSSMKGLAFEVDGNIHYKQFKTSKDQLKYQALDLINVGLCVVPNEDLKNPSVEKVVDNLKLLRRLDSRSKARVLKNIYLFTICCFYDFDDLCRIFRIKRLPKTNSSKFEMVGAV